jgi:hypothetical protein
MLDALDVDSRIHLICRVVGYQFPDDQDDNWCLVRVEVDRDGKTFEKVDPALETPDLIVIQDWFRALANDQLPRYAHLTFTEPCLSFEFIAKTDAGIRLAVQLSHELRSGFPLKQLSARLVIGILYSVSLAIASTR